MKKLRQWINARRDRRLRKWCIEQAITVGLETPVMHLAQEIYNWLTETNKPSKHGVNGSAVIRTLLSGCGCDPTCEHYPNLPES